MIKLLQKKSKNKSKPKIKVVNVGKVRFERIMVNLSKKNSVPKLQNVSVHEMLRMLKKSRVEKERVQKLRLL